MDIRDIDTQDANVILAYDETHFRDLKAKEIAPGKLSQTLSAFANTAGGEVFIGIAERPDGTRAWEGFDNPEAANGLIQAIESLSPLGNFYSAQFLRCPDLQGLVLHLVLLKTGLLRNWCD